MAGDEFYDDDVTSGPDLRGLSDFRRKQLRESSACAGCGSLEPARIVGKTCSDCTEYPRCSECRRWTHDGFCSVHGPQTGPSQTAAAMGQSVSQRGGRRRQEPSAPARCTT